MSKTRICKWHKRFKKGCEEVEDDPRSGRPSTSESDEIIVRVKQLVRYCCWSKIYSVNDADERGLKRESVLMMLLDDLEMKKCAPRWYPRFHWKNERKRYSCENTNHSYRASSVFPRFSIELLWLFSG